VGEWGASVALKVFKLKICKIFRRGLVDSLRIVFFVP
jgi:hypothetical protein